MLRVAGKDLEWDRQNPTGNSVEVWSGILSGIRKHSLKSLAAATGLTKSACSRIRAGEVVPHPRHWEGLLALTI